MLLYDSFLGENFIKCLFRYYSMLPVYIKEMFIDIHLENIEKAEDNVAELAERIEKELQIKLNLKLSHFPYCVKRIDPKALLSNNLL